MSAGAARWAKRWAPEPAPPAGPQTPHPKAGGSCRESRVAARAPSTRRKGDRLPRQINMHPRQPPRMPNPHIFIQLASPTIPATWRQYLAFAEAA